MPKKRNKKPKIKRVSKANNGLAKIATITTKGTPRVTIFSNLRLLDRYSVDRALCESTNASWSSYSQSEQSYSILAKVNERSGGDTGLVPDWTDCDGNLGNGAVASFCKDGGRDFWYDAIRTPWRLSTAAAWSCDPLADLQLQRLIAFWRAPSNVKQGYTVDGSELGVRH